MIPPVPGAPRGASRRLTALGGRVLSLGIVLGLLATLIGSRELLVAGAFTAALPVVAALTIRRPALTVAVSGGEQARVGVPLVSTVTIRAAGQRRSPALLVRLLRPHLAAAGGVIDGPAAGESVVWSPDTRPLQRGIGDVAHLRLGVCDDFGLALRQWSVAVPAPLRVAPGVVAPPPLPLPPPVGQDEPGDLRAWRPGDPVAAVAWRASARRGSGPVPSLLLRQRVPEEPAELRLAVTSGSPAALERALEVVAAVGTATLAQGRPLAVHLDRGWIRPTSPDALLDALARVQALGTTAPACDVLVACADLIPTTAALRLVVDGAGTVRRC